MAVKHSIIRVQLDTSAKDRLDTICKRRGMTQVAMVSRLVNWFSQQDDYIQTAVLQTLSEGSMAAVAKSVLKKISSGKSPEKDSSGG
jgi:Replication regulatory protein RepB